MALINTPFIPGVVPPHQYPLDEFIPEIPRGVVTSWLKKFVDKQQLILDPLGTNPYIALEMAKSGYRVLVICNNPIIQFMIELFSLNYDKDDYQAALSELSYIKRGEERLDLHLMSLYNTRCQSCSKTIPADAFIWKKGASSPEKRIYTCGYCGDQGERNITSNELDYFSEPIPVDRYRYQALQRVKDSDSTVITNAQEAICQFTPLQLYFIFTLLNKLESHNLSPDRQKMLHGLIIQMLQESSTIWPWPGEKKKVRHLSTPQYYLEKNAWQSLEQAIEKYGNFQNGFNLYNWPELPPQNEPGICMFSGRMTDIPPEFINEEIKTAIVIIPRPNQAFWTLSTLWSGWLWRKEKAIPMQGALKRKRYDWNWHSHALISIFEKIKTIGNEINDAFCILPEFDSEFLSSTLYALNRSNWNISGISMRFEDKFVQMQVQPVTQFRKSQRAAEILCRESIHDYLTQCNEPRPIIYIDTLCRANIFHHFALSTFENDMLSPIQITNSITQTIEAIVDDPSSYQFFKEQSDNNYTNKLWLNEVSPSNVYSLTDRIEQELLNLLSQKPMGIHKNDIENKLCELFPGFCTPEPSLITKLLNTYASQTSESSHEWFLKNEEKEEEIKKELARCKKNLQELCNTIGFLHKSIDNEDFNFEGKNGIFQFFFVDACTVSNIILNKKTESNTMKILLLPERRVEPLIWKMSNDPRLLQIFSKAWKQITFEEIGFLLTQADVNEQSFIKFLNAEAGTRKKSLQMKIFS